MSAREFDDNDSVSASGSDSDSDDSDSSDSGSDSDTNAKPQQSNRSDNGRNSDNSGSSSSDSDSNSGSDDDDEPAAVSRSSPVRRDDPPAPPAPIPTAVVEKPPAISSDDDSASASSESSSEDESEFNDGYDDQLMGDSADRQRLENLTEKEREQEIFKRIERRDVMKTRWEIERKLKLAKRAKSGETAGATSAVAVSTQKRKRSDDDAGTKRASAKQSPPAHGAQPLVVDKSLFEPMDFTDSADDGGYFDPKERSKERKKNVEANRTDDKRSSAMAMLKAKREGKAKREEQEAKRQAERADDREEIDAHGKATIKLKASDIYSDDSGSSSSSDDDDDGGKRRLSRSPDSKDSDDDDDATGGSSAATGTLGSGAQSAGAKRAATISTANKEQIGQIRLSRHKIERFIALPHFDRVVTGCFVRISIGNNNNRPVYRVAEIVGVVETSKIYTLGKNRTNKGLRLKHGTSERVFRLEFVSNQDFSDSEFDKWRTECAKYAQPLPTVEFVERKMAEIKDAIIYEFKDEDVHRIIAEKNRFRKYPTNYAMKKTVLMKERDAAVLRGDDQVAADITGQIDELDERANELDKRRSSTISSISYINDRNRKRNVAEAEKAIMEEVRASRGQKNDDPFTRRSTKPTMAFKTRDPSAEMDRMPIIAAPMPVNNRRKNETADGRPASNNLYSLHDFDIELNVALPSNPVNVVQKPVLRAPDAPPKRTLNLEEYKKKRGLI